MSERGDGLTAMAARKTPTHLISARCAGAREAAAAAARRPLCGGRPRKKGAALAVSIVLSTTAFSLYTAVPTTATPWNSSGSVPPQGTIAFEGSDGLYLIDAGGGTPRKIAGTLPRDGDPALSPDGRRIAFDRGGDDRDIWVMDADGSNQRRLTSAPGDDGWPQWAPNGNAITFESDRRNPEDAYVVSLRRGQARRVARNAIYPDWRPDGRITFQAAGYYDVESVRPYGSDRRTEASDADEERWVVRVSRDGKRMVFTDGRDPAPLLSTSRLDGSDSKRILRSTQDISNPVWSPDGQWISFSMGPEDRQEVYIVRTNGRDLTRLTTMTPPGMACCPDWSPQIVP